LVIVLRTLGHWEQIATPEVSQFQIEVLIDQDVLRLYVEVQHASLMHVLHSVQQLPGVLLYLLLTQEALLLAVAHRTVFAAMLVQVRNV